MVEGAYSKQRLTQYLLGSLPETEVERFDELSVTDTEFADALSAAENDLVDAYVQGELASDVLEQFKSHYLVSPLKRAKVEFAKGFQGLYERDAAAMGHFAEPVGGRKRWFSTFFAPRYALQWSLAAVTLMLFAAGTWFVLENRRLRQQVAEVQASRNAVLQREQELQKEIEAQRSANSTTEQELARIRDERQRLDDELRKIQGTPRATEGGGVVSMILAPPLRGGQVPTVSIKAPADQVAVQLQLEPTGHPTYRVALMDPASGQTLWRSGMLKPQTRGGQRSLHVSFRADLLSSRNYILTVRGISGGASEIVGDYPFRVVK